jgi:hypothetical protein
LTDAEVDVFLRENYGRVVWRRDPSGRVMAVVPRAGGDASIILCELEIERGWEQEWQYRSSGQAHWYFLDWDPQAHPEPEGWLRHVPSDRRREGGDPARETVRV